MTIKDAIAACQASGLTGWDLASHTQALVCAQMTYSYDNSFDFPLRAFARGKGYCWQQAGALNLILRGLGFESRLVHAMRNRFPDVVRGGKLVHIGVSGHAWCRVTIDGVEKDLCPGNPANRPGVIHFEPLSAVRNYSGPIVVFGYLGSAWINWKRGRRFRFMN